MPTAATPVNHAPYLRNKPDFDENEGSIGSVWVYRIPEADGLALPVRGDVWADGNFVTGVSQKWVEKSVGRYYDVTVSTVYANTGGGPTITTKVDSETRYELQWGETYEKLIQHVAFMPGGAFDLHVTYGSPAVKGTTDALGWEYEIDPERKLALQYRKLDSSGKPSVNTTTITNPSAKIYCKLRRLGYDTIKIPYPIWQEITVWRGKNAPDVDVAGQFVPTASIPSLPSNLAQKYPFWIQSATPAERLGSSARWRVTRSWTGGKSMYFDIDTIFASVAALAD
jgi:hypothetical protein